jgi:hypothetical protein
MNKKKCKTIYKIGHRHCLRKIELILRFISLSDLV